jgi:hypothetical protein
MKKILIALSIFFISCEKEEIRPFPCLDGSCGYAFAVDTFSSPGAKLFPDGYWRVKHNGINYFTIRGLQMNEHQYITGNSSEMSYIIKSDVSKHDILLTLDYYIHLIENL